MRKSIALFAAVAAMSLAGTTGALGEEPGDDHCGDELGHIWHEVHEVPGPYVDTIDGTAGNTGVISGAYETVGHEIVECTVIKTVEDQLP